MGWFDDTITYSGDINITHLIDKLPENPIKAAVREAIQNDYEIVDAVSSARQNTMGAKVLVYYDFVKAESIKVNPTLHLPICDFPSQLGDVLPIITIRENRNNILGSGMVSTVEATTKALSKINLNLTSITNAVNRGDGTVNDVHVMFAANVYSDTDGTAEYFFRLFNKLYDPVYDEQWWMGFKAVKATDSFDAAAAVIAAMKAVDAAIASGAVATTIDSLSLDLAAKRSSLSTIVRSVDPKVTTWNSNNSPLSQGYKTYYVTNGGEYTQNFSYLTVSKEVTLGVIGPVGHYVKTLRGYNATSSTDTTNLITLDGTLQHNFDSVSVSKQITPTVYETYSIYGMSTRNQIRFDDGSMKYLTHSVSEGSYATFIVPLFTNITKEMSDFSEEKFLSDSLILYVQTVSVQKTAWYQSSWFMWLVMIVIIVIITIVTWGSETIQAILLAEGLMAAVYATVVSVAIDIISGIALSYIIKGVIAILTPLIGAKAATALTLVAVIAITLYTGYGDAKSLADLPWAEVLLKTSASVIDTASSVMQVENKEELLKLTAEITGFALYSDMVNKELKKGLDLLDSSIDNLLYSTVNSVLLVKETPDDFYQRTIHQGNVGMLGISAVSDYTQNKLVLPKEFPSYLSA